MMSVFSKDPLPDQKTAFCCFCLALFASPLTAIADGSEKDWQASAGLAVGVTPAYWGADTVDAAIIPLVEANYQNRFYLENGEAGAALLLLEDPENKNHFSAGGLVRYRAGRDASDHDALNGFDDLDPSAELGLFLKGKWQAWEAHVSTAWDVAGGHEGMVGDVEIRHTQQITERFALRTLAGATFGDKDFMGHYFGVPQSHPRLSGYQPEGGFASTYVGLAPEVFVTDQLSVAGLFTYERLVGDAEDSPLVTERGSPNQFHTGVGLRYHF